MDALQFYAFACIQACMMRCMGMQAANHIADKEGKPLPYSEADFQQEAFMAEQIGRGQLG